MRSSARSWTRRRSEREGLAAAADAHRTINALQRSTIALQKSLKEGFRPTVTERSGRATGHRRGLRWDYRPGTRLPDGLPGLFTRRRRLPHPLPAPLRRQAAADGPDRARLRPRPLPAHPQRPRLPEACSCASIIPRSGRWWCDVVLCCQSGSPGDLLLYRTACAWEFRGLSSSAGRTSANRASPNCRVAFTVTRRTLSPAPGGGHHGNEDRRNANCRGQREVRCPLRRSLGNWHQGILRGAGEYHLRHTYD